MGGMFDGNDRLGVIRRAMSPRRQVKVWEEQAKSPDISTMFNALGGTAGQHTYRESLSKTKEADSEKRLKEIEDAKTPEQKEKEATAKLTPLQRRRRRVQKQMGTDTILQTEGATADDLKGY